MTSGFSCPTGVVRLFHRRWMVPLLAELHRSRGSRFVVLVRRLGTSRSVLRLTLQEGVAYRWIMENPGHGHPLRPEYLLTSMGHPLGSLASEIEHALRRQDLIEVGLRKWSMPVLLILSDGARRFGSLRARLPGITDRSLALALDDLERTGLLERHLRQGPPPANEYALAPRARSLARHLTPLLSLRFDQK